MKESPSLFQLGVLVSQQLAPQDIPHETWREIIGLALQHGLASMLLWVTKQSAPDMVTEPLWTPVIVTTRGAAVHHVILDAARRQVSVALDEANIPTIWLKGIALSATVYPQPVLRPMGDLDVLVPYTQREEALRIVEKLGYHFGDTDGHLMTSMEALRLNLTHHYHLLTGR